MRILKQKTQNWILSIDLVFPVKKKELCFFGFEWRKDRKYWYLSRPHSTTFNAAQSVYQYTSALPLKLLIDIFPTKFLRVGADSKKEVRIIKKHLRFIENNSGIYLKVLADRTNT